MPILNFFVGNVGSRVEKNDKWGFVDKKGNEVIPCIYNVVLNFSEGLAVLIKEDKYGFIDKSGKEVIPCIYNDVNYFKGGLSSVKKDDKWGFVDKKGLEYWED